MPNISAATRHVALVTGAKPRNRRGDRGGISEAAALITGNVLTLR